MLVLPFASFTLRDTAPCDRRWTRPRPADEPSRASLVDERIADPVPTISLVAGTTPVERITGAMLERSSMLTLRQAGRRQLHPGDEGPRAGDAGREAPSLTRRRP